VAQRTPAAGDASPIVDCGINALHVLLHLEGRDITFARVAAALPRRDPRGYSMAELRDAAKTLGLDLVGVQSTNLARPPERPFIVFVQNPDGGHFAVIRPIGSTGALVQVIDPPHVPRIVDFQVLSRSPMWTGRMLIREESLFVRHSGALPMIAALAAAGAVALLWKRRLAVSAVKLRHRGTVSQTAG
jgi:hypothetical protein